MEREVGSFRWGLGVPRVFFNFGQFGSREPMHTVPQMVFSVGAGVGIGADRGGSSRSTLATDRCDSALCSRCRAQTKFVRHGRHFEKIPTHSADRQ